MNKPKFPVCLSRAIGSSLFVAAMSPAWSPAASSIVSGFSGTSEGVSSDSSGLGGGSLDGIGGTLLDGLSITTSLSAMYDSNIDQRAAAPGQSERDDFIMGLGGKVKYLSKSSDWTFGANYRGYYKQYVKESAFSSYDQGLGAMANYEGGRVTGSLIGFVSYAEGSNRDYDSQYVERINYGVAFESRYRMSSKTTLEGEIGQSYATTVGDDFGDTEALNLGASALWKYSPLTEWGPGLRYTYRTGSSQTGRTSIGPTVKVNYKLSTKITMDSRFGLDFPSYDNGESGDASFATSVGLKYEASKLWGMNFMLIRDTEADPSNAGAFTEVTSVQLGYTRKIRRAKLDLGVAYSANRAELPDSVSPVGGEDRDYYSIFGNLGMMIFSDTTSADLSLRYSEQSSNIKDTWDAVQVGVRLSRSF